jgi:hypoxanthine phosphoribosyltransferase
MADSGETLALVAQEARSLGAVKVVTAALVSHSWADPRPDVSALVSDALVIFPWNRVLLDGEWKLHPELEEALRLQNGSH